jgi:hypothetical protein
MKHARADYDRFQDPAGLIPADEPVFLIRGQDIIAPEVLRLYAERARALGQSEIARLTEDQADRMIRWQDARASKVPDLPLTAQPAPTETEA